MTISNTQDYRGLFIQRPCDGAIDWLETQKDFRSAWHKVNANPKNRITSDCVLRALHHATGETWEYIAHELFKHMLKTGYMMNDKKCYIPFIESYGFKACKVEIINGHKPTVKDFALTHTKGIYILRVAGHIVTVKDGLYLDSWDSGSKSIYKYWRI